MWNSLCPSLLFTVKKSLHSPLVTLHLCSYVPLLIWSLMFPECKCGSVSWFFFTLPALLFFSLSLFLHVASIPHLKIASLFLKDPGRPFYSNFYLDKVRLQLIRKPFRQYLNANGFWKSVPSPWRSRSSVFSRRATVAFFPQLLGDSRRRAAGAAAPASARPRCLQLTVAWFTLNMHWITLFWGLLLNDKTFNVCICLGMGSELIKWLSLGNQSVIFVGLVYLTMQTQVPLKTVCRRSLAICWIYASKIKIMISFYGFLANLSI